MKILTTPEVAKHCGVTPQATWKWKQKGFITPINPSSKVLFYDAREIEAFNEKRKRNGSAKTNL